MNVAYEKQNFEDGKVLTAAQLNHIEDGIAANEWTPEKQAAVVNAVIAELPVYNGEILEVSE